MNCLQPIKTFQQIPPQLQPTIILKKADKRIAKQYFLEKMKIKLPEKNVIYSDSLFNELQQGYNHSESYVHITWKESIVKSIRLNQFNIKEIDVFVNTKTKVSRLLPKNVILGSVSISFQKENFFVFDYKFDKCYVFSNTSKKLLKKIDEKNFDKLNIYKILFGDTAGYYERVRKHEKNLSKFNRDQVELISHNRSVGGRHFIELGLSYVEVANNETRVYKDVVFAEWIGGDKFEYYKIAASPLLPDSLYALGTITHKPNSNQLYNIIMAIKVTSETNLIGLYEIDEAKKEFIFKKQKPLKYPDFAPKKLDAYYLVYGHVFPPNYFFIYENLVGDIETGKSYPLISGISSNNSEFFKGDNTVKPDYYVYDVVSLEQEKYRSLLQYQKKFYVVDFDNVTKTGKVIKEIALPVDKEYSLTISPFTFAGSNKICAISTDNELIEIDF
jgi:hypothetical protein